MATTCTNCAHSIESNDVVHCPNCGAALTSSDAAPSPKRRAGCASITGKLILGLGPLILLGPVALVAAEVELFSPLIAALGPIYSFVVYCFLSMMALVPWARWVLKPYFPSNAWRWRHHIGAIVLAIVMFFINVFVFLAGCAMILPPPFAPGQ
ncbi:MAG: hypothetical protein IT366_11440 [Candidatus Hydrogenedentes bacterium]|nr:hypothetical protein [Candidatus Hydrogenedentota bacterium]